MSRRSHTLRLFVVVTFILVAAQCLMYALTNAECVQATDMDVTARGTFSTGYCKFLRSPGW